MKSESELIQKMKEENVKLDIDFVNFLIKRRFKRKDYENAKVLFFVTKNNLLLNNLTDISLKNS